MPENIKEALALLGLSTKNEIRMLTSLLPKKLITDETFFQVESETFFERELKKYSRDELFTDSINNFKSNNINSLSIHYALLGCYIQVTPSYKY